MKRILIASIAFILAFSGVIAYASVNGSYKGKSVIRVTHNGVEVKPVQVPGYLEDGYTMLPLGMLRSMGFTVEYNSKTMTANVVTETKPVVRAKTPLTLDQIKALKDRIALIYALDSNGQRKEQGSGFVINSNGLLVTAYHVIEQYGQYRALEVHVRGRVYKVPAGVTAFEDANLDVAGVYLQDKDAFPYLKVGVEPKEKDAVYALGFPDGTFLTQPSEVYFLARGNIFDNKEKVGGISGGPLLNGYGEVIGTIINGDTIGESVSISKVMKLYQDSFNQ